MVSNASSSRSMRPKKSAASAASADEDEDEDEDENVRATCSSATSPAAPSTATRFAPGLALGAAHSTLVPSIRRPVTATDPKRHVICVPKISKNAPDKKAAGKTPSNATAPPNSAGTFFDSGERTRCTAAPAATADASASSRARTAAEETANALVSGNCSVSRS